MSTARIKALKNLVSSLTKSEKRHFRLYTHRLESNQDGAFIKLFDLLDSDKHLDESLIKQTLRLTSVHQFSNLKRHLFSQICIALRLYNAGKSELMQVTEMLELAWIMRTKGLPEESLYFLNKISDSHSAVASYFMPYKTLLRQELELLGNIDTRESSIPVGKDQELNQNSGIRYTQIFLEAYRQFKQLGFSKNAREALFRKQALERTVHNIDINNVDPASQSYLYAAQAVVDLANMNLSSSYKAAIKAFQSAAVYKTGLLELKARILEIALNCSYLKGNTRIFHSTLSSMTAQLSESNNPGPYLILLQLRFCLKAKIQFALLTKQDAGVNPESEITRLEACQTTLNTDVLIELKYYIANYLAYKGHYARSLDLLNEVLDRYHSSGNPSIINYFRMLHLICHYRLGHFQFVDQNIINLRNNMIATENLTRSSELLLSFIRKGVKAHNFGLKDDIRHTVSRLAKLKQSKYDLSAYLYFDYITWLESIGSDKSVFDHYK